MLGRFVKQSIITEDVIGEFFHDWNRFDSLLG